MPSQPASARAEQHEPEIAQRDAEGYIHTATQPLPVCHAEKRMEAAGAKQGNWWPNS
jgi:phage/plasmid primase-like uncharacterized protein